MFVVEDKFGLCGYGVATADGRNFYDQYKDEWLPKVRKLNHSDELTCWTHAYIVMSELLGRGFIDILLIQCIVLMDTFCVSDV